MMRFILPFYFLFGVNDVIGGFLRGRGKSLVPMIVSLVFMTGFRLLWIWLVTPVWSSIDVVFMAYPISWVLTFAVLFVYLLKTYGLRSDRQEEKTLDPL
jgi:Na+-driven multidrug efflux pump